MLDHVHFIILTYTAFEFKNGLVNVEINTKNNHFIHVNYYCQQFKPY